MHPRVGSGPVDWAAPLVIETQGSFAFGGTVQSGTDGSTRGDHGYARFQIPVHAAALPLVLWHGGSTSGSSWESTPDGREGFATLLSRLGFSTYTIDQPRKGRGGEPTSRSSGWAPHAPYDRRSWNIWRLGFWEPGQPRTVFDRLQLPTDDATIDQFIRWHTAASGPPERAVILAAMAALLDRIGPSVLVVHSNSGQYAWQLRHPNVRAIIAYEPGAFAFDENDLPPELESGSKEAARVTAPIPVPAGDIEALCSIPIQIVYGDNFTEERSADLGRELWRLNRQRARQFVGALSRGGGDASVLSLPEQGQLGNTHFPFADLNNRAVAELLVGYLASRGLT